MTGFEVAIVLLLIVNIVIGVLVLIRTRVRELSDVRNSLQALSARGGEMT